MDQPVRIAMWSGPRNISTAMLRSWGNRPDTFVCDEPLYAYYLVATGLQHPGREAVLQHHDADWQRVTAWLTGPIPDGRAVFYQKHMAHHLLPDIDRAWLADLTHAFLIRDPGEMLSSLVEHWPEPTLQDTGLPQQLEIAAFMRETTGQTPPIVDSRDVLKDPAGMLELLCGTLGVPFDDSMLSWPAGPRPTDGVWGKHWYDAVWKSTGFQPYRPKSYKLSSSLAALLDECQACYDELYAQRLTL